MSESPVTPQKRNSAAVVTNGSSDRRRRIVDVLRTQGRTAIGDLADLLDVSHETIRRDLEELETSSLITRVRGGALPFEGAGFETTLQYRSNHLVSEKRHIADAAVEELAAVQSLFLDDGYTPLLIAQALARADRPVTVVTPSVPAAAVLAANKLHTVIMLGGRLRDSLLSTSSHWGQAALKTFVFDAAVLGSNGITIEHGLTTPDAAVSAMKALVVERTRKLIFVGVHTKFGVNSFARFAGVEQFQVVITDRGLSSFAARRYTAAGPRVIRV